MQSTKEREEKKVNEEIQQLLSKPTAKVLNDSFFFSSIIDGEDMGRWVFLVR